jgi:hypothetical protein
MLDKNKIQKLVLLLDESWVILIRKVSKKYIGVPVIKSPMQFLVLPICDLKVQ